ncbi:serine hydrolase domain-containing protein [Alkalisalibacterium limincola]|uniref:Beta-lactamase family protein n=1 Tax=Alkalisalibacterium limincola TaxID=2699169 RepID=A0A5C8L1P3_9GAMM|nr:serine hydrolase domain-containing protein [Alkalisalibacterium limincola]TXK65993.1 beta-lactamase family protein [Alkalisalibacterium limincola]
MALFRTGDSPFLRIRVLAFAALVPIAAAWSSTASHDVDARSATAFGERQLPGLAITVLRGDEVLFAKGYGRVDTARGGTVDGATVFQLGSISKQFLAVLVLSLAEEERLSLDDSVLDHLPDHAQLPPGLTVRHLLNHTSGLRELLTVPEAHAGFDDLTRSRAELVALVRQLPVDFPPGTRWSYSNTNYTLLALIVEQVTREPYEDALAERFFRPLQLSSMRQCLSRPRPPADAVGHEWHEGGNVEAAAENMNWIRGDGGLCGSAIDVARWTRLLATGRVVPAAVYEGMTAPTQLLGGSLAEYGFGLSLVDLEGRQRVGHNGAMRGFSATAAYYPDAAITIVVLANRGDVRTESIERPIARQLLGLPEARVREAPLSPEQRHRYLGEYDIGIFDVQVLERDGQLWLEMPRPGPTTSLTHLGNHTFAGDADPDAYSVTFDGTDGAAQSLRLLMGGMRWHGLRSVGDEPVATPEDDSRTR